jgi:hypothetical protein
MARIMILTTSPIAFLGEVSRLSKGGYGNPFALLDEGERGKRKKFAQPGGCLDRLENR